MAKKKQEEEVKGEEPQKQVEQEAKVEKKVAELTFEEVLPFLKEGKTIRRKAWGLAYRLRLQKNFGIRAYKAGYGIDPKTGKRRTIESEFTVPYCVAKSFDAENRLSWSPSLKDILAEDWLVVLEDEIAKEAKGKTKK